ncbi:hypothetical protein AK812_SmicGene43527 [Symbiodinium microadriaticum]|uniref:Uncharacterized protein n=1 Tax=Symbiodinium microadriaticum TaxID=2951 RepID=A0A1Q9C0T8_SYMMI|nr:hypothetical protein AK812_SmicGene43527 [Symbiodinium microadriaticum]
MINERNDGDCIRSSIRSLNLADGSYSTLCTFANECFNACGIDPTDSMIYCEVEGGADRYLTRLTCPGNGGAGEICFLGTQLDSVSAGFNGNTHAEMVRLMSEPDATDVSDGSQSSVRECDLADCGCMLEVWWVFKLKQFAKKLGLQAGGKPRLSPVSLMSACSGMLTEGLVMEELGIPFRVQGCSELSASRRAALLALFHVDHVHEFLQGVATAAVDPGYHVIVNELDSDVKGQRVQAEDRPAACPDGPRRVRADMAWVRSHRRVAAASEKPVLQQIARFALQTRDIGTPLQRELARQAAQSIRHTQPDKALHSILFDRRPVVSGTAEAQQHDTARSTVARKLSEAACALLLAAPYLLGIMLCKLLDMARGSTYSLVSVVVRRRYDETPCRISVSHEDCREQGTVVKILQSELTVALLVHDGTRFAQIRCTLPTHLKALESNTAEQLLLCQRELLALVPELSRAAAACHHPISLVTTDAYAANRCAENGMAAQSSEPWKRAHYYCDVHRMHNSSKKQHSVVSGHFSAMIYSALAAQQAGGTRQLRRALCAVLEQKLRLRCLAPESDSFESHRLQSVLDLFLPLKAAGIEPSRQGRLCLVRRYLIAFFLNGDTTDEEKVVHMNPSLGLTRDQVLHAAQAYLVPALIPHKPPVLSKKSWTGAEAAISWFGLLAALHNLLEPTMLRYTGQALTVPPAVHTANRKGWSRVAAALQDDPRNRRDQAQEGDDVDFEGGSGVIRPGNREAAGPPAASSDAAEARPNPDGLESGDVDWAEYNRQLRLRLVAWVRSKPASALIVIKTALKAPMALLEDLLTKSGVNWENLQQSIGAETGERTFVALEACKQTALKEFFLSLRVTFHTAMLGLAPAARMRKFQVLLFRMLLIIGSSVRVYLGLPWGSYPLRLFRAYMGDMVLLSDADCTLCNLGTWIKEQFPDSDSLQSNEAKAVLHTILSMFSTDIAQIEANHSATRRVVTMKSVQSSRPNVERASAEWLCRGNFTRKSGLLGEADKKSPAKQSKKADKAPVTYGWAWKAFLNERLSERISREAMSRLSREFAALSDEESQRYEDLGNIAQAAAQRGLVALPKKPSRSASVQPAARDLAMLPAEAMVQTVEAELARIRQVCNTENREHKQALQARNAKRDSVEVDLSSFGPLMEECPALADSGRPVRTAHPLLDMHLPADDLVEAALGRGAKTGLRGRLCKAPSL